MAKFQRGSASKTMKSNRKKDSKNKVNGITKKNDSADTKKKTTKKSKHVTFEDEAVNGPHEEDQGLITELDDLDVVGSKNDGAMEYDSSVEDDIDADASEQDEEMDEQVVNNKDENFSSVKSSAEEHKRELEELKERDPEFYNHLQKESSGLLDFDLSDEEDIATEDSGSDSDQPKKKEAKKQAKPGLVILTKAQLNEWLNAIKTSHDLKSFRNLLVAFKSAVRSSSSSVSDDDDDSAKLVYKISEPSVFTEVLRKTLHYALIIFQDQLKLKSLDESPMTSPQWSSTKAVIRSYLSSLLHYLKSAASSELRFAATREAEKCSSYWACFPSLAKPYLKALVINFASFISSDSLRIQSFLAIRSLASKPVPDKKQPTTTYLSVCLKNVYLEFVRNCKTTNIHTLPAINLMRNLAVDLYGLDQTLSYEQAFVYIRQLAMHLRGAMQQRSKEGYKPVYNWQYIHCIDFWANVLTTHCQVKNDASEESPLKPLIYPLVQIALGTIRLIPTSQYFPLRFHVLRSMIALGKSTQVYIPLASELIDILESSEVKRKPNPSTLRPLEWDVYLKAPQPYLHSRVYQDGILEQFCDCLTQHYESYSYHISFPEFVIPSIVALKRSMKKLKNVKGAQQIQDVVSKLENKSAFVTLQRSKIDFSPSEQVKVNTFLEDMKRKLQ